MATQQNGRTKNQRTTRQLPETQRRSTRRACKSWRGRNGNRPPVARQGQEIDHGTRRARRPAARPIEGQYNIDCQRFDKLPSFFLLVLSLGHSSCCLSRLSKSEVRSLEEASKWSDKEGRDAHRANHLGTGHLSVWLRTLHASVNEAQNQSHLESPVGVFQRRERE